MARQKTIIDEVGSLEGGLGHVCHVQRQHGLSLGVSTDSSLPLVLSVVKSTEKAPMQVFGRPQASTVEIGRFHHVTWLTVSFQ